MMMSLKNKQSGGFHTDFLLVMSVLIILTIGFVWLITAASIADKKLSGVYYNNGTTTTQIINTNYVTTTKIIVNGNTTTTQILQWEEKK
jgi:hypothetical protein